MNGSQDQKVAPISAYFRQRLDCASQEYLMRLREKAATMRRAVQGGETDDGRVLVIAAVLERLAGNGNAR